MPATPPTIKISPTLMVLTVPAFCDNYLWLIHNGTSAIVIDPGDAAPILAALQQHHLKLVGILLTHHHADHIGGVTSLLQQYSVPVYGPHNDGIACVTHPLHDNEVLLIEELALPLTVLAVPGHTLGHIAYYAQDQASLFCGDTLFGAGCGRLFEGTPLQMYTSLMRLAHLPANTFVFCAHEYTLSNLRFAKAIEPNNQALINRIESDTQKRALGLPTIPSTIGLEVNTNPFLRCDVPDVINSLFAHQKLPATSEQQTTSTMNVDIDSDSDSDANKNTDEKVTNQVRYFAALREWKNIYA